MCSQTRQKEMFLASLYCSDCPLMGINQLGEVTWVGRGRLLALGEGRPGSETSLLVWVHEEPFPGYDHSHSFICHTCTMRLTWGRGYGGLLCAPSSF